MTLFHGEKCEKVLEVEEEQEKAWEQLFAEYGRFAARRHQFNDVSSMTSAHFDYELIVTHRIAVEVSVCTERTSCSSSY